MNIVVLVTAFAFGILYALVSNSIFHRRLRWYDYVVCIIVGYLLGRFYE